MISSFAKVHSLNKTRHNLLTEINKTNSLIAVIPILLVMQFGYSEMAFSNITIEAGLDYSIMGEGVCIFDYNNDGLEDIFVCDRYDGQHLLFKNNGNMSFSEESDNAGINNTSEGRLAISADYNHDGYLDLFIGAYSNNSILYKNNGDGTFSDVSSQTGINVPNDVEGGAWCDFNRDGWIDLYVGRLRFANVLYQNNGDGTFTDVAYQKNATGPTSGGLVMGLTFIDFDADGDDDIFITRDGFQGNILLRMDANHMYTDVSINAGVALPVMGMGAAVGDYDRNGIFDIYTTNLNENSLLYNNGDGTFSDLADSAGVEDLPGSMAWGTFFFDADNDGWLDIYNNNQSGFGNIPNSLFHNQGNGVFLDVADSLGIDSWNNGIGSAYGDLDNDGDLDFVLAGHSSDEGSILLFENTSTPRNWIQFILQTEMSNPQAIGSIIEVYEVSGLQKRYMTAGDGYCSQNTLIQHFGLGELTFIDSIVIYWPNGERENFGSLNSNHRYNLLQGTGVSSTNIGRNNFPAEYSLKLYPNYPNPFNGQTEISYYLPNDQAITISLINIMGIEKVLFGPELTKAGHYTYSLKTDGLSSGLYFYSLKTSRTIITKSCILIK